MNWKSQKYSVNRDAIIKAKCLEITHKMEHFIFSSDSLQKSQNEGKIINCREENPLRY